MHYYCCHSHDGRNLHVFMISSKIGRIPFIRFIVCFNIVVGQVNFYIVTAITVNGVLRRGVHLHLHVWLHLRRLV